METNFGIGMTVGDVLRHKQEREARVGTLRNGGLGRICHADGTWEDARPKNGTDFKLEELNAIVGKGAPAGNDMIEIVPAHGIMDATFGAENDYIIVLNEEGKCVGLPFNLLATFAYGAADDVIVGDVLICRSSMVK